MHPINRYRLDMPDSEHEILAHAFARKLGSHLKTLRVASHLTQHQVAELLGPEVAVETVSRFERGANAPSLVWVSRLAAIYGSTIDDIFVGAVGRRVVQAPERQALHEIVDRVSIDDVTAALQVIAVLRKTGKAKEVRA